MLGNRESVLSPKLNIINKIYHVDPRVQAKNQQVLFFHISSRFIKRFQKSFESCHKNAEVSQKNLTFILILLEFFICALVE